jgi:IS605 OrfB family transposase
MTENLLSTTFAMKFKSLRRSRQQTIPIGARAVFVDRGGVTFFPKETAGDLIEFDSLDTHTWDQLCAARDPQSREPLEMRTGDDKNKKEKEKKKKKKRPLNQEPPETEPCDCKKMKKRFWGFRLLHGSKLVYERSTQRYVLHVTLERPAPWTARQSENQALSPARIIALDPGVRTFLTGYSPDTQHTLQVGDQSVQRLCRLSHYLDEMDAKIDRAKTERASHSRRQKLRRARLRMYTRLRHLADEVHWQTANVLTRDYDVILLPSFGVSDMVRKQKDGRWRRRIGKNTARRMLLWAHYRFRQRLAWKARQRGVTLLIVNEAWTSKTCCRCGRINDKLGGSKVFRCDATNGGCGLVLDRDVNGAVNILLRNLGDDHGDVITVASPLHASEGSSESAEALP